MAMGQAQYAVLCSQYADMLCASGYPEAKDLHVKNVLSGAVTSLPANAVEHLSWTF